MEEHRSPQQRRTMDLLELGNIILSPTSGKIAQTNKKPKDHIKAVVRSSYEQFSSENLLNG